MRRTYFTAGGVLLAALVCAAVLARFSSAEDRKADAKESGKSPSAAQLPNGQVVLFSSGVGYFQHFSEHSGINALLLYNFTESAYTPYTNPIFRIGFVVGL